MPGIRELLDALRPLERPDSPLDPIPNLPRVHWAEPALVIRAEFAEWTADGLLRQAVFTGIEPGRDPADVVRERTSSARRIVTSGHRPPPRAADPGEPAERAERAILAASDAELAALDSAGDGDSWWVGGHEVRLTNLAKVIVEADPARDRPAVTKRDLIRHYCRVAPLLIPYLADRGTTVQRFPNGTAFWSSPGAAFARSESAASALVFRKSLRIGRRTLRSALSQARCVSNRTDSSMTSADGSGASLAERTRWNS